MEHIDGIIVIGAGPAGLMAASAAVEQGLAVTIFEGMRSGGRKFLVAGKGGLNLTHSEPLERFLERYGAARARLEPFVRSFPPDALRAFADGLGQKTWIGSSGRVFPREALAAPMLRTWIARLKSKGVVFRTRHRFLGFGAAGVVLLENESGPVEVAPEAAVLALGGGSWPSTGSDGSWVAAFAKAGIGVAPLTPSNAGVEIVWDAPRLAGTVLKNVELSIGGHTAAGEVTITGYGLEGGPVYALTPAIRAALLAPPAILAVDLKPSMSAAQIAAKLSRAPKKSLSTRLGGLKIPGAIATLLKGEDPAPRLKRLELRVERLRPLAEAISSAGGVRFDELDDSLMLIRRPGTFLAGEMIDWEAPTGGYLLQACFSTGRAAGRAAAGFVLARHER